jgi:hypothetical protein
VKHEYRPRNAAHGREIAGHQSKNACARVSHVAREAIRVEAQMMRAAGRPICHHRQVPKHAHEVKNVIREAKKRARGRAKHAHQVTKL